MNVGATKKFLLLMGRPGVWKLVLVAAVTYIHAHVSWELITKSIIPAEAAAAGCVALIPSRSRILTAAPLVLAATGFYRSASLFGANTEVAAGWVGGPT